MLSLVPGGALRRVALLLSTISALAACSSASSSTTPVVNGATLQSLQSRVNHVVVIYQENWSFDGLYGQFPGANGTLFNTAVTQTDTSGNKLTSLPQPLDSSNNPDPRFPASLPVQTYDASKYVGTTAITGDINHVFYHEQLQIDGGKMDRFAAWSTNPGLTLSQFDGTSLPLGQLAQQYTLTDNLFHSAFGGSFLNHQFLICACAPTWPNAPANYISTPNNTSNPAFDTHVTPDGYAVNTSFSSFSPHPASVSGANLVPPQTATTIGDELSAANVSWKWYSGGWNNAIAGNPDPLFQFHHQAFAYYTNYGDGTPGRTAHLRDETEFFTDVQGGTLPSVVFIKPLGQDNEHPGYASLLQGDQHAVSLISAIQNSQYWNDTVIIVTFDENGGRWDHVAPPVVDRWGPGSRVPGIVVSRFARKHFVDHTQYETDSILALIEKRWGLKPMGTHDANANPFMGSLDFNQP